jgi:hypothetical protein
MGVFLFGTLWVFATTISDAGLRGPTFWGRRITIGWNDVASVKQITVKGIPYLIVKSASSTRELWLCRLGLDVSRIYRHIRASVSSNHPFAIGLLPKDPLCAATLER